MFDIDVSSKKTFIDWFLSNYPLKIRESVWILKYLVEHPKRLNHVHFVEEVRHCPRGIMITSKGYDASPFRFYKNFVVTTNAEKCFHDIRVNPEEALYIQLNFKDALQSPEYVGILEDNPFSDENSYSTEYSLAADKFLEHCIIQKQKDDVRKLIDESLDNRDKHSFYQLSKKLIEIGESI